MFKKVSEVFKEQRLPSSKKYVSKKEKGDKKFDSQVGGTFNFLVLVEKWEEIVGKMLAKHTTPLKNVRKTLTILTDHPAYAQQLSFIETELIKKIIARFPSLQGNIKRVRFQTNPQFFEQQSTPSRSPKKVVRWHQFDPRIKVLEGQADKLFIDINSKTTTKYLKSLYIQLMLNGNN